MKGTPMTIPPLPPQRPNAQYQYRPVAPIAPQTNFEPPIKQAPTLSQFWRSDLRRMPGRKRPTWAGVIAFWLGLASAVLLIAGTALEVPYAAAIALGLGTVGIFFGLVAIIAGIARLAGVAGIILALVGNVFVLSWLGENVL
jgi:multidrug transporter EmrE-like cation transporter